ncbi:putative cyclic AMP-responsive element-binding protein 3-like protein 3 [Calycina marina]|uniref:Cyclic AMP-responsive element-binding protein 3-like protein 3 n=1 Tax=Calycina marina TaxID=1763456 RepID=A0A9P7Z625_9HELO|nr:putative cyclic AMP-responsive element-binding protein 3-like protein 3 [Calycina marina]
MTSTQQSGAMSTNGTQAACLDPVDSMLDFSEYETVQYPSPSLSPGSKSRFSTRSVSNTPPVLPSSTPTFSGPSHNYDMYRQTTGIPQGAIANTLAVNSNNVHINQYGFADNFMAAAVSPNEDFIDFGSAPIKYQPTNMDGEFESPTGEYFYPEQQGHNFINPSTINGTDNGLPSTPVLPTSNVGRLWPGMHQQQAALAKSQARQKQQQIVIQQQQQRQNATANGQQARQGSQRVRAANGPADPIVEEKISQLLNSMRQSSVTTEGDDSMNTMSQLQRTKKDEEEMDEDERLLASEEGKKLSSKERRQLRNKVSARAFRSRRKEYIGQLEGEIAQKVNENTDLRSQNRALLEENTRLSDLTRMLLSSPSFSGFLDTLSQNPTTAQSKSLHQLQQTQQPQQQVRKDVNPYAQQQQHIGMTLTPEQNIDFSTLDLGTNYGYQPQVFSVHSIPETILDAETLSGKPTSAAVSTNAEKIEIPVIERSPIESEAPIEIVTSPIEGDDEEFDRQFELYATSTVSTPVSKPAAQLDFTGLLFSIPAKPTQYTLILESSPNDREVESALRNCSRLSESIDRLFESLSSHL